MRQKSPNKIKNAIPAVCTALELIRLLAEGRGGATSKELADSLGISATTCYRIINSLIDKEWVRPLHGGRYEVSVGLLSKLDPLRQVEQLATAVQPELETLVTRTRLTATMTVRQGEYAVVVACCDSPRETAVTMRVGAPFHLATGSSGTVFLSGLTHERIEQILEEAPKECWAYQKPDEVLVRLEQLEEKGWCADMGSYHPSLHTVSVPLHDTHGGILAAVNVIGFPHELPAGRLSAPLRNLLDAVRRAERKLRLLELETSRVGAAPARGHKITAGAGKAGPLRK